MIVTFTKEEQQHLLYLLELNSHTDDFYGNKKKYRARANDIIYKLGGGERCPNCGIDFTDATYRPFCSQQCQTEFR